MTANINVRVDSIDKEKFERFCENTGMNISCAINMFIKNVLKDNKLPFMVSDDPFYSEENINRLMKAKEQIESGHGTYHDIIEV